MFAAIVSTPGYLPDTDVEAPVFDTASEAWDYLATERREAEDDAQEVASGYSATANVLESLAAELLWDDYTDLDGCGTVMGPTPGYDGEHDLGVAYSVSLVESDQ